jgi:predicted methyltransferase
MKKFNITTKKVIMVGLMAGFASFTISTNSNAGILMVADETPYTMAVNNSTRPEKDVKRDATRKPASVLEFFGIEKGMTVLDVLAGGGYYTHIMSKLVGDEGSVIMHNNPPYIKFETQEVITARIVDGGLTNVKELVSPANDLGKSLEENSVDVAIFILGYHDIYYKDEKNWEPVNAKNFMSGVYKALKLGAILGVVDHVGSDEMGHEAGSKVHRISPNIVRSELEALGFKFDGASKVLANPEDDSIMHMGNPKIRGRTDRFVYRFKK